MTEKKNKQEQKKVEVTDLEAPDAEKTKGGMKGGPLGALMGGVGKAADRDGDGKLGLADVGS